MDILKSGFTLNSFYSMTGFGVLVLTSFVFNAFLARRLGVQEFGIYLPYFYLLLGFSQPINSLQLVVAKYTAEKKTDIKDSINEITPALLIIGLLVFGIFILLTPFIINIYHLKNICQVMIGGGVIMIWLILNGYRGVYLGRLDFRTYSVNMVIEGMARLISGLLFIFLGFHVMGAIGASLAGGLVASSVMVDWKNGFLIHHLPIKNWKIQQDIIKEFFKASGVFLPFGIIISLDLVMVQYLIGGSEAGYISMCGQFGKNLISLSLIFANVAFTYSIKRRQKTFWYGIGLTTAVFFVFGVITLFAGGWMVNLVGGIDYKPVINYLTIYIFASLPFGIMQSLLTFSIAKNISIVKVSIWAVLIILVTLFYFAIKTLPLSGFLWVMMGAVFLIDLVFLFFILMFLQKERAG
jgi:O-antigen/teichoic acid export membrane protein